MNSPAHCSDSVTGLPPADAILATLPELRQDLPVGTNGGAAGERRVPLTDAQREIWYACQLGGAASRAYNEAVTLQLDGRLEVAALRRALKQLVARHEALRTTFAAAGDQQRIACAGSAELTVIDCRGGPAERRDAAVEEWAAEVVNAPFDLTNGPLWRAGLLQLAADSHWLVLATHHLVCDGWSLGVLQRDLGELYSAEVLGRPAGLPGAPSFAEYAAHQASASDTAAFASAEQFWREQYAAGVPVLELPTDRARPVQRTFGGGRLVRTLPAELTRGLQRLCGDHGCTTFTALLTAFSVMLHRLGGQEDLVIGVPAAGQVLGGRSDAVGQFANLLPIRSTWVEDRPVAEHLDAIGAQVTRALDHWRYPFARLLHLLSVAREPNRVPLAPVVFNTVRQSGGGGFAGLGVTPTVTPKRFVNFDLSFRFALADDTITLGCYYSSELYDEATLARWFGHFETLLRGLVAHSDVPVSALPLLREAEQQELLLGWNSTALPYDRHACIHQCFEAEVRRTPDAIAVVGGEERWTYRELNRRADAIAAILRRRGVGVETPVGLFLDRSPLLVAAMLGVLKAGGTFVPLDPAHPKERLVYIAGDAGIQHVLTERRMQPHLAACRWRPICLDADSVLNAGGRLPPPEYPAAEDLAYVIYTSGSTGRPKGVCLAHRGVVALAAWARQQYSAAELGGVLFATPATFDVSIFESLVPLCVGGRIIVAGSILDLPRLPHASEVTLLSGVPSAVAELVRSNGLPVSVRTVNLAGEVCPQPLVEALLARPHLERVYDLYGPTEATVYSTGGLRSRGGRATIGRPLPNEQAYIVDARLQPVPIGVPGELCLGGDKLARGYLNQPELTHERFVSAPFLPGRRIYRTGDRARWLPDGRIEFLGRRDHQVKIRGHRIELGEVETVLAEQPAVRECVVVARPDPAGGQRLIGYFVAAGPGAAGIPALRAQLAERLPEYMLPAALVAVESLPRTPSGKLDRNALPAPDFTAGRAEPTGPRTTAEELLTEIWSQVLGVKPVGVHDSFFALGGHSLLAAQVISRVAESLGIEITLQQFFAAPTIAGLAPMVEVALLDDLQNGARTGPETAGRAALGSNPQSPSP